MVNLSVMAAITVKLINFCVKFAPLALSAALAAAWAAPVQAGLAEEVGEVTLTIGRAMSIPATGAAVAVQRGSKVRPGDRIETAEGGHVHIRFVDGAMISVRPTSRLVVEEYQYNAAQVAQSSVKFRLEKGVTRAISGAAAEGARERFRLNTPLVAIGVRGTDFVVRTGADQTIAVVNQGSIVMAPFGEGCVRQGFGPCGSSSARLLSADMGSVLVEFRNNLAQPELRPFNGVRASDTLLAAADARATTEASPSRESKASARSGDEVLAATLVQSVVRNAAADVRVSVPVPPVAVMPPVELLPVTQKEPPQLAWGRWGATLDATDFALARTPAREGRVATVGDNDFILYRVETSNAPSLPQGLGNVSFTLDQAHARFTNGAGQVQAAAVQNGTLSIDFNSRAFSTSLGLTSLPTGAVSLQATGSVRDDGVFVSRTTNGVVAGATALDGKTAGYLFEKAAAGGTLSGITLWAR